MGGEQTVLSPIFVSATRSAEPGLDIPAAKTIIDRTTIENSGARDIAELLRSVTGVHVSDPIGDGGNANIDMRGFGGTAQSNVAVLINGRKINPTTDTATLYLNAIDLSTVERIEIIEGSAGTLYGNQAVGGLINIITSRPDTRMRNARIGAGSFDTREASAGFSEPFEGGGINLQLHRRDSDNYRDENASRLERLNGRLELEHHGGYSYLDLQLLRDRVETPGALLANELAADRRQAAFVGDFLDTDSDVARFGTQQQIDAHWRIEAELAFRDDHRSFVQSFRGFPGSRATQDRESIELTPRLIGRYDNTVITIGADYLDTDYALLTSFGPQNNDQEVSAVYAQLTRPVAPKVTATVGIRHGWVNNTIDTGGSPIDIDDNVTVGSLGFVYRPEPEWRLFLRADQNYRFAKVDEHTNVVFGQPVGLDTQRGVSYETGAEYNTGRFSLALQAFHLRLKDEISFDSTTFANVNLPRSRRNGLALLGDVRLDTKLKMGAAYEYTDAEITSGSHDGSLVPLVPEHKANLFAEYRPLPQLMLRLDIEHIGEQFLGGDFANASDPLDAYTVVDLTTHYDIGDWRLSAKFNNLFDERYSETGAVSFAGDGFFPAPGRSFWIGANYSFEE